MAQFEKFQGPMQPFPGLERWSRQVYLPGSQINLHLYDTGEDQKTPVLLLHGLGDEADTWRHVLPGIRASCRAVAPDLPGFGRSDTLNRPHTIPFFVDTLFELLDHLSIARVVLTGHSTGAVIAHAMALQHPERVEQLVLISGSLVSKANRITLDLLLFMIPGLGEWLYNRLRKDPQAAFRSLEPYYHRLNELPQADLDFLYQRVNERVWSDGQRQGFFSTLRNLASWLPSQQKDLPERLKSWNIPTILLWGENDQITPVANAHALVELQPVTRLVIVPDGGHNLQQENAAVVLDAFHAHN